MTTRIALLLIVVLAVGHPASVAAAGQQRAAEPRPEPTARTARASSAGDDLPVSLERIKRKLAQSPQSKQDALRLQYFIEVYGKPVTLDFLRDFDVTSGPVQYGPMTHREFVQHVTPQEFRSPAADLRTPVLALLKWLSRDARERKSR